jgi:GNAT superfamily N-acetyltransferase
MQIYVGLEELYVLPSYERRGIASSLLERLKKHADEHQLPIFMEAVTNAKNLYLRHGFIVLQEYVAYIPYKGMEGLQPYSNWHMIREPVRIT